MDELNLKGKYKFTGKEVRGGREVKGFCVEHKGKEFQRGIMTY